MEPASKAVKCPRKCRPTPVPGYRVLLEFKTKCQRTGALSTFQRLILIQASLNDPNQHVVSTPSEDEASSGPTNKKTLPLLISPRAGPLGAAA